MIADSTEVVFRSRLAAVRKARGLTQEALASSARDRGAPALTRGALAKVESGERHARLGEAFALAQCLDVPLDDLCRGGTVTVTV